jgi:hypothetical protein
MHLQMLDFPTRTIQTQSAPENAGTKHLSDGKDITHPLVFRLQSQGFTSRSAREYRQIDIIGEHRLVSACPGRDRRSC